MNMPVKPKVHSLASQHRLKREKLLMCDHNTLSQYDVKYLIQYCSQQDSDIAEHLLLASLFTGRSIEELAKTDTKVRYLEGTDYGVLFSKLDFPNWEKEVMGNGSLLSGNLEPFVILPRNLIESIEAASRLCAEDLVEIASELLQTLNRETQTRLTLVRIKQYMRVQAVKCSLSQAEINWISNTPLKQHGGSSYLSMSGAELAQKHYRYVNALMKISALAPFDIEQAYQHRLTLPAMGSNFHLPEIKIKFAISELTRAIGKMQKSPTENRWRLFNYYTYYTLILLNMCTGHRPSRNFYKKLDNFDLSRGVVFIDDKGNRESARVVPLNDAAVTQLRFYLSFLEAFIAEILHLESFEAQLLLNALNGQDNIFYLWTNDCLKPFSYTSVNKTEVPVIKAKGNWNRHWIRSSLARRFDLKPAAIDAFMGHENLLDESFSSYSTLNMSDIRDVADALGDEICSMAVEPLEVTL